MSDPIHATRLSPTILRTQDGTPYFSAMAISEAADRAFAAAKDDDVGVSALVTELVKMSLEKEDEIAAQEATDRPRPGRAGGPVSNLDEVGR